MDLKTTLTGNNRKTILELCEYGEDAAQKAYKTALEEGKDIKPDIKEVISRQKDSLKQSHDIIKQYRNSHKGL